jgi:hypothetical protein
LPGMVVTEREREQDGVIAWYGCDREREQVGVIAWYGCDRERQRRME